jgi:NAD(P)-dependent dehydrogenase (short-subunit alcohol dehydrogenase family)
VLPQGHVCLITDDGTPLAGLLAEMLAARGWNVAVAALDAQTEIALVETLDQIRAVKGEIGVLIHLHPPTYGTLFAAREKIALQEAFLLAKHLKASINAAAKNGCGAFITVTRLDGELGTTGQIDYGLIGGGLAGLTKTLRAEWDDAFCRAVDLHPQMSVQEAADCIMTELFDPNRLIAEVGYGERGRITLAPEL